jgi:hypothetical protein
MFLVLVLIVLSIAGGFISYQLVRQQELVPDVPKAGNQLKSEESGDRVVSEMTSKPESLDKQTDSGLKQLEESEESL